MFLDTFISKYNTIIKVAILLFFLNSFSINLSASVNMLQTESRQMSKQNWLREKRFPEELYIVWWLEDLGGGGKGGSMRKAEECGANKRLAAGAQIVSSKTIAECKLHTTYNRTRLKTSYNVIYIYIYVYIWRPNRISRWRIGLWPIHTNLSRIANV